MPVISFGNVKTADAESAATVTAVVPVSTGGAVGPVEHHNAAPQLVGDWGGASEATPSLLLSQKTSKYVEEEGPAPRQVRTLDLRQVDDPHAPGQCEGTTRLT
jgi:hypothetical protein